jgi:UDP-N-acetylmuramoylalanine--D-glutamate ligase
VRWYNDSMATAPERTVAALRSFDAPIVLLAGGRDKKLPWDEFATVAADKVVHLVLFGEAAPMIERVVRAHGGQRPVLHQAGDLAHAVETAASVARAGDVVLLSPGGTSFDAFKDFAERGNPGARGARQLRLGS